MKTVIDASVALKWVFVEVGSAIAQAIAVQDEMLAPDFLLVECANVVWSKTRKKQMTQVQADQAFSVIQTAPIVWTSTATLLDPARRLAALCDLTIYDALYLALAQSEAAALATADVLLAGAGKTIALPGGVKLVA